MTIANRNQATKGLVTPYKKALIAPFLASKVPIGLLIHAGKPQRYSAIGFAMRINGAATITNIRC